MCLNGVTGLVTDLPTLLTPLRSDRFSFVLITTASTSRCQAEPCQVMILRLMDSST